MVPISKVLKLFRRYAAISLAAESEYRTDFLSGVVLQLFYALMMILFWEALIRAAGGIPGWGMGDLVLMTGLQILSNTAGMLFFRMGSLPSKVLRGELDRYLTKPAPALLCLQWETLYLHSMLTEGVSAVIVILAAVFGWGFRPVPGGVLPAFLLLLLGTTIQICLQTSVAALIFWLGRVDGLQQVLDEVNRFRRFPVTLFDRPVERLLTWVWPFGLTLTYPVLLMRGEAGRVWLLLGGGFLAATAWLMLVSALLRAGLRRYESFGG